MGREKYLIEIIMIGKKTHTYTKHRTDKLMLEIPVKTENMDGSSISTDVAVEPKDLYEVSTGGIVGFFIWLFTGQIRHYLVVVDAEGAPIKEASPEISGKVLRVARDWKGLGRAISDSFGSRFEMPKIAMVGAIGIGILIIIILIWRGYIPLPRSWGI